MKTQEELIGHYEEMLKKVMETYQNDWRMEAYIKSAEEDLEAVKNGRQW